MDGQAGTSRERWRDGHVNESDLMGFDLLVLYLLDVLCYCKFSFYKISQKLINQLEKIEKKLVSGRLWSK